MQSFFAFLKSKYFFLHTGIILTIVFLAFFFTLKWLSSYTNHGEFVVVPDFAGQAVTTLDKFVEDKDISYKIIDSIYDPAEKPGVVLRQDPEMNSKVKHNRTIYLYVTGMVPPQVIMPKLVDRSERQARLIISSYGLKLRHVTYKDADCNGCVLEQLSGGREIESGKGVKKGSVIDLVVGKKDSYYSTASSDTTGIEEEPEPEE
jgi:eukaryotic-like serine/threonine-protein kinase